jgi:tetratricopeptide (TPR) repeat protein
MRLFSLFVLSTSLFAQLPATPAQPPLTPIDKLNLPKAENSYADAEPAQGASLNGNALFPVKDKEGVIAKARQATQDNKTDAEAWLARGRAEDSFMHYQESVETYSIGIRLFPDDIRFVQLRGRRQIILRKFDEAVKDLESIYPKAKTSFDVAYYLGIAYYLNNQHEKAAEVLGACEAQMLKPIPAENIRGMRTCDSLREDPNTRTAVIYWRYLALRRAGRMAEAKKYLGEVSELWELKSGKPFWDALMYFKGVKELNEIMGNANEGGSEFLTRSSAAAVYLFTEGERKQACGIWQRNALDTNWDRLGVILAEAEYYRNSSSACALYGSLIPGAK